MNASVSSVEKVLVRDPKLRGLRKELKHSKRKGDWENVEKLVEQIQKRTNKMLGGKDEQATG